MQNLTAAITVQPVALAHANIVAEFVWQLIDELAKGAGPSVGAVTQTAQAVLQDDHVFGVLAYRNDEPVGLIMLNECTAIYAGGVFGEITELYVMPECRSAGIAGRLMEEASAIGRMRGWKRLEVGAPQQPEWRRSLDFYMRLGFEETGPRLRRVM